MAPYRTPPYGRRNVPHSPKSSLYIFFHSILLDHFFTLVTFAHRSPSRPRFNQSNQPPIINTRFFNAFRTLRPLPEESPSPPFGEDTYEENDQDDDLFEWDEEKTLVAALMHDEYVVWLPFASGFVATHQQSGLTI